MFFLLAIKEKRNRWKKSAEGGSRTHKPCGTGFWDLRVCQFRHFGEHLLQYFLRKGASRPRYRKTCTEKRGRRCCCSLFIELQKFQSTPSIPIKKNAVNHLLSIKFLLKLFYNQLDVYALWAINCALGCIPVFFGGGEKRVDGKKDGREDFWVKWMKN